MQFEILFRRPLNRQTYHYQAASRVNAFHLMNSNTFISILFAEFVRVSSSPFTALLQTAADNPEIQFELQCFVVVPVSLKKNLGLYGFLSLTIKNCQISCGFFNGFYLVPDCHPAGESLNI